MRLSKLCNSYRRNIEDSFFSYMRFCCLKLELTKLALGIVI